MVGVVSDAKTNENLVGKLDRWLPFKESSESERLWEDAVVLHSLTLDTLEDPRGTKFAR